MKIAHLLVLSLLLALVPGMGRAAQRNIYPDVTVAHDQVAAALKEAAATHKRVLLEFGGNWCPDCQMLDIYMHEEANAKLVEASYVVVHVNIGRMDANLDIAEQYGVPLNKGVPAVAVVNWDGKLLYSQRAGEFEAMRRMQSSAVTEFLETWKPQAGGCATKEVNC